MEKELCFNIEGKELYLEHTLVDYNDIPIFFLCRNDEKYYAALCTDIEILNYIVVAVTRENLFELLHGRIPMRNIFLSQKEYWEIISGEEIVQYIVVKHLINELDVSVLPRQNACFQILTEEISNFVKEFDCEFFNNFIFKFEENIDFSAMSMDMVLEPENIITEGFEQNIKIDKKYMQFFDVSVEMQNIKSVDKSWDSDEAVLIAA